VPEKITLRFAEARDVEKWMELVHLVADDFPGLILEDYKKILAQSIAMQNAFLASQAETIIGVLMFNRQENEISFLAVHPQFRQQGVARGLLNFLLSLLPPSTDIHVTTYRAGDPKGVAARALYKNLGFTEGELLLEFGYPTQKFILKI